MNCTKISQQCAEAFCLPPPVTWAKRVAEATIGVMFDSVSLLPRMRRVVETDEQRKEREAHEVRVRHSRDWGVLYETIVRGTR